jgi:phosphate transport system substrate-binding protein
LKYLQEDTAMGFVDRDWMKLPSRIIALAAGMHLLLAAVSPLHAEPLRVVGESFAVRLVTRGAAAPIQKATGATFSPVETGPNASIEIIDTGKADFVLINRPLDTVLRAAEQLQPRLKNRAMLQQFALLEESGYAVIVNRENPVNELSLKQLTGLFTGRSKSWDDAGGSEIPVILVMGHPDSPGNLALEKAIGVVSSSTAKSVQVSGAEETRNAVAGDRGAIGIISANAVNDTVKRVRSPELVLPSLTMVTVGFPYQEAFSLLNFLRGSGQKHLRD